MVVFRGTMDEGYSLRGPVEDLKRVPRCAEPTTRAEARRETARARSR